MASWFITIYSSSLIGIHLSLSISCLSPLIIKKNVLFGWAKNDFKDKELRKKEVGELKIPSTAVSLTADEEHPKLPAYLHHVVTRFGFPFKLSEVLFLLFLRLLLFLFCFLLLSFLTNRNIAKRHISNLTVCQIFVELIST